MKMSHKFLALLLSTLVLSGCSSCPKKNAAATPAPAIPEAIAAPAAPAAVQESAPAMPEEPAEEKVPAAVLK
jgi:PBP1b-binding outer membrane lipoprotein LpoB